MKSSRHVPLVGFVLLSGLFAAAAARSEVIDFETPSLGDNLSMDLGSSAVMQGVTFSSVSGASLQLDRNEHSLCLSPGSQRLRPVILCYSTLIGAEMLRADLPAAPAVYAVRVRARVSGACYEAMLKLFDSSGQLLAWSANPGRSAYCFDDAAVALSATAGEPVAYATITAEWHQCDCGAGLCGCPPDLEIDDFTFGDAAVPARASSWGSLKVLYR